MKTFTFTLKKTLFATAAAATLGLASAGASAATVFNDFEVNPSNYSSFTTPFTADKIIGGYTEVITLDETNQTFNVSLQWSGSSFYANDGTTPLNTGTGLNSGVPGSLQGYGLYALYQGSGTFERDGLMTQFITNPGSGGLSFYLDPQLDATFTPPGTGSDAWTVGGLDDTLLATGTPQSGSGTLGPGSACSSGGGAGINCGSFGTSASFKLTDKGKMFFTMPVPFYDLSFQSGQFNDFSLEDTQTVNGSLDVTFSRTVPEPGTLALLGLAIAGLGVTARRRAH